MGSVCDFREALTLAERGRLTPFRLEFRPLDKSNEVFERVNAAQVAGLAVITP